KVLCVDASLLPIVNKLAGKIPSVERVVVLADGPAPESPLGDLLSYEELLAVESGDFAWPDVDERDAAVICHTSGTTGQPKGVAYSHRSEFLHAMSCLQGSSLGLSESDAIVAVVPLFHANGWGLPYAVAMAGATLIL